MRVHTGSQSTFRGSTMKITVRVPKPRPEPTPGELLRRQLADRARTPELLRRLARLRK